MHLRTTEFNGKGGRRWVNMCSLTSSEVVPDFFKESGGFWVNLFRCERVFGIDRSHFLRNFC